MYKKQAFQRAAQASSGKNRSIQNQKALRFLLAAKRMYQRQKFITMEKDIATQNSLFWYFGIV